MRFRRRALALAAIGALAVSSCSAPVSSSQEAPLDKLILVAPADVGGGWGLTAEAMKIALEQSGAVSKVSIQHIPGNSGTLGLQDFVDRNTDPYKVLLTGMVMVGGSILNEGMLPRLRAVTPLIGLTREANAIFVRNDAPYPNAFELFASWKKDGLAAPVAGGGYGSDNMIVAAKLADQLGMERNRISYLANNGGGAALKNRVYNGEARFGVTGIAEILTQIQPDPKTGTPPLFRVLAVTSDLRLKDHPVAGIKTAPTVKELGYPDFGFYNWRAVVGTPGLAAPHRDKVMRALTIMSDSKAWDLQLTSNRWLADRRDPANLSTYLHSEIATTTKIINDLQHTIKK